MSHKVKNFPGLVSLNGNLLCAVDTETTGVNPDIHDIIEIAVVPLDNHFKPSRQVIPFNMSMRPARPENVNLDALNVNRMKYVDVMTNALDCHKVLDLFMEWFEKLNLGINKRISPLGCNWPFDREMIRNWMGPASFELVWDARFRDVQSFASSMNDCAEQIGNKCPYPTLKLGALAKALGIDYANAHEALSDCRITAEVYAEMVKRHCPIPSTGII